MLFNFSEPWFPHLFKCLFKKIILKYHFKDHRMHVKHKARALLLEDIKKRLTMTIISVSFASRFPSSVLSTYYSLFPTLTPWKWNKTNETETDILPDYLSPKFSEILPPWNLLQTVFLYGSSSWADYFSSMNYFYVISNPINGNVTYIAKALQPSFTKPFLVFLTKYFFPNSS